jgi:hypothetical protein
MRIVLSVVLAALLFAFTAEPQGEALFNGKDLAGFYTFLAKQGKGNDPDKVFTVAGGMIRVSGKEFGYIATEKEYENYRLTVEFKWGEVAWPPREKAARDSGILFHMTGPDKVWPKAVEFQIIEGGTGDIILVGGASIDFDPALEPRLAEKGMTSTDGKRIVKGRVDWEKRSPEWKDVLGFRGPQDLEKPAGEWNTLELEANGGVFSYRVNGTLVVKATGVEPAKGRILFQSEGAEIFFRKIELRPLGAK